MFKKTPIQAESFIRGAEETRDAIDTHITIKTNKVQLHKFMVDDETIYIQEEFLKFFEPDAHFKGSRHNTPLYVYEFEELVGMILPVNYKEGGEK